jgi:hypothetical protein
MIGQLDQVADSAVKLIAPVGGVDACREAVKDLIAENGVELANRKAMSKTKAARKAAGRVAGAFRRVEVALKNEDLDPGASIITLPSVIQDRSFFEKLAKPPSGKKEPRWGAEEKRIAVQMARQLMLRFSKEKISAKPKSSFCRLAALLYGKPSDDLSNQCKKALSKKRGSK